MGVEGGDTLPSLPNHPGRIRASGFALVMCVLEHLSFAPPLNKTPGSDPAIGKQM